MTYTRTKNAIKRKINRFAALSAAAASAVMSVIGSHPAHAEVETWTGAGTANFNDAANWTGSVNAIPLAGDSLVFGTTGSFTTLTNDLTAGLSITGITFNSGASAYTIGGNSIALSGGITNSSTALQILNFDIATTTAQTISLTTGGGNLTLNGAISGTGGSLVTAGAGTLTLGGATANTFTGGVTLASGTQLNYNKASAIGTGTFTISGGTLDNTSGAAITAANNNALNLNGDFTFAGSNALTFGTGAVTLNAARQITVNGGGALTVGGAVSGATFGITKAGTGTLVLNGVIGTTTGGITVNAGVLTLGGNNTYTGAVTLASGATLNINNAGALSTGTFTINGGTINNTTAGAITNSKVTPMVWGGDFTFTGSQALNLGTGAVTALTANRQVTVNGSGTTGVLTVGGTLSGAGFTLTKAGTGNLTLTGVASSTLGFTVNGGTLQFASGTANTNTGTLTVNNTGTLILGNKTVNVLQSGATAPITVNSGGTVTFQPGTTGLTYANVITVNAGGTFTLDGSTASSPASLTLSATTNNLGGSIILNQGRLVFNALTNIGNAATPITINGSTTNGGQFWANAALAIANPITFNGSAGPLEAAGNLGAIRGFNGVSYSGAWTLASGNSAINPESGNTVTISSAISGPGGLVIGTFSNNRGGAVTMTGANNTFAGGVQVSGATLNANAAGVLGTGPVVLNNFSNTVFAQSTANALTGTNSLTINGGTATLSQANNFTGGLSITNGTLNVNAAGAIGNNSLNQTGGTVNQSVANAFQGPIGLNLSGGTTNLSSANAYTGGAFISGSNRTNVSAAGGLNGVTTVTGGTLSGTVTAAGTYANNGSIVISGGVLVSGATGGNFQNVSLSSTGFINPGGVGTIGTAPLVINNLNTGGGSLQFDIQSLSLYDQISLIGTNSFGAGTNISFASTGNPTLAGNYKLIQYVGGVPSLANFVLPTAPSGLTYSLSTGIDAGFIDLVVAGTYAGVTANWLPTATGTFSWNTGSNWSGGSVPKTSGDIATFNSALAAAQTVTVDGQQHVGTLTLNPSAAFAYTINAGTTGSTIYLDNGASAATLSNVAQNNTIAAPIVLTSANTNVTVANGTALTLTGTLSGAGGLTMAGTGTGQLNLNGTGAWTGGTIINGGVVAINATGGAATQINNAGVGTTTLNGGTLSFTATTGTTTPPAGFSVVVGAAGGTINASGATTAGKLLMTSMLPNWLTGSGTLTKTGGGDLQISIPTIGFSGDINMQGLTEVQNSAALGFGTTTGYNGGTMTVGPTSTAEVVSSGIQIFQPITLSGGVLSANGSNNAIFNNTVNVTAASTLRASQFQGQTVANNFGVNTLTGSGALSIGGSTTANAIGMVTVGDSTGYTGAITVGANAAIGLSTALGTGATIANFTNTSSGIGLVGDGDGTSSPQTIAYVLPSQVTAATFGTGNTTGYLVGRVGATRLFNQEANKTIAPTTAVPLTSTNTLLVQPFNGYGLLLANQPALTATTTFGVGTVVSVGNVAPTAQASNVIAGLTLTNLTGAFDITKTGVGTLQLGLNAADASNTFGAGATASINVTQGTVSAFSDQNLGAAGNGITLNNTTSATFLALDNFSTSRTITLASATGATVGVAFGKTLTLNSGLAYSAATNTFTKSENGTLILTTAATGAPTSGTTISGGVLQISNANQVGSGTITNATAGAALAITGNVGIPLALNSVGVSGAVGGLTNVSGANSYSGAITINGGSLITNQDAGNAFTLGAITNTTTGFNVGGAGTVILSGAVTGAGVVNATGVVRVTSNGNTTTGSMGAYGSAASLTFAGASGSMSAGTLNAQYGGTINFDNSTNNLNNRSTTGGNQTAFHSFTTVGSANLNLIGNSGAATTENLLGLNSLGRGQTNFTVSPDTTVGQPANLILTATGGAFTRGQFGTATFASSGASLISGAGTAGTASASINVGPIPTAGSFQGAGTAQTGTANIGVLPWALVNNNGTVSLATASVIGANGYLRNLAANESRGSFINYLNANAADSTNTLATTAAGTTLLTNNDLSGVLFVGQSVSGANIPAGAYITAISGTSITLSAAGTAAATNVPITFGTTGTNISLSSVSSGLGGTVGQAGTLTQSINSLTLAAGGSLTQPNSNTLLTIGGGLGGAIVSLDNAATISGGQLTAGTNELIVHTPNNLTISSNIVGGAGGAGNGLTKAAGGVLTLTGTSYHAGQTVINAGTLTLNAGDNTIAFPNYTSLGSGATLNLNGNAQVVLDLFSDSAGLSGLGVVGGNSSVTGTSGSTLVVRSDGGARNYTGVIGGQVGLMKSGSATWTLTRAQTYSGPTLLNGGTTTLQNDATLPNTSLTISRATLNLDNTGSLDNPDRLPNALAVTLNGGGITYTGRANYVSTETVGAVTAAEGASTISVTNNATGISSAQLTLTSVSRTAGATLNFTNTNGTLGTIGSNPMIFISGQTQTTATGATSILGGGFTVNGNDFAGYNTTFGVGALGTAGFAGYSPLPINNAASTDNVSMGIGTGVSIGSMTVNSLRATGTVNVPQTPATTLTVASGGLLSSSTLTIGALPTGVTTGTVINQGNVTSGGNELFLLGTGTINLNSAVTGTGVALVKSGSGTTNLNGTNGYTGGTYVDQGTLALTNSGNVTVGLTTLGTGGIFVNGGTLTQSAGAVIPSQALTVSGNGVANLSSSLSTTGNSSAGSATITVASTNGIAAGQLVTGVGIPAGVTVASVNPATNTVTLQGNTAGIAAGTGTAFNFLVTNTLTGLTFNNNGGTTTPAVNVTGVLNLSSGSITASSSSLGGTSATASTVSTLSGGTVDLQAAATPTFTVNPVSFNGKNIAPYQPTLIVNSALQNSANPILVTGGGNLQLGGASTFTGGVSVASGTSLTIAASSTNQANGAPLSGPLGMGTLTLAGNTTLYSTGNLTVGNNVAIGGNIKFDAPSATAASLALGAGSQSISLPAAAATTVTVGAPNMTGIFNATVTGAGSSIVKEGLGTLQLTNNTGASSTFSGGVTLNNGTLVATGVGATGTSLGTGAVTINGGVFALKHSGQLSNSVINFGNNVTINGTLTNAYIDVNNNGANTGNTIQLGRLSYTGFTSGSLAPTTVLNVTGGNAYKLQFTGFDGTNPLTSAISSPTFNVGAGLTLIIPGGFTVGTNLPINLGAGTLAYSGTNIGATAGTPITGTVAVAPGVNATSTPLGTGDITINAGGTLQITPVYTGTTTTSNLTNAGYTSGGMTGKLYNTAAATMADSRLYGIAPGSTLTGIQANDSLFRQFPVGVNTAGGTNTQAVYQGLLNVTNAGTYYFGGGTDDQMQVTVDGQLVITDIGAGHGLDQRPLGAITLGAGPHSVVVRAFNNGGGGSVNFLYAGPDTAANGITGTSPVGNVQALPLSALRWSTTYNATNNYQNAAVLGNNIITATTATAAASTIDGLGTDFNYAIPALTLGTGAPLVVANGTGAAGSIGNGAFIVTGNTDSTAGGHVNPTTGTLVLAGGVTDSGAGLTKSGQGNLILNASSNFTGTLNINGGFVQLNDPAALTTGQTVVNAVAAPGTAPTSTYVAGVNTLTLSSTTGLVVGQTLTGTGIPTGAFITGISGSNITISAPTTAPGTAAALTFSAFGSTLDLNGQAVTTTGNILLMGSNGPAIKSSAAGAALYNSSGTTATLPVGGTVSIGAAVGGVNATVGGYGDITINGTLQDGPTAGTALNKVSPNTLTLNGTNTFTGTLNVTAGKVVVGSSSALGTTGGSTIVSGGAALDLNGFTVSENLTLNGGGVTVLAAPNTLGALINSSVSGATVSGTTTLGSGTVIGGPSFQPGVNGSITLSGLIAGAQQITKTGGNALIMTNGAGAETLIDIQAGSVTMSGSSSMASLSQANFLRQNATWTLDNSVTAVNNRMGNRGLWMSGTLNVIGNATTGVQEIINTGGNNIAVSPTFANGYGGATITLNAAGTAGVVLGLQTGTTSTSLFNRGAGGTMLLRGDNLGQNAITGTTPASFSSNFVGNGTSLGLSGNNGQAVGQAGVWNAPNALVYPWNVGDTSATGIGQGFVGYNGYTAGGPTGGGAMAGTAAASQANAYGSSPISSNSNNSFAPVSLNAISSANTTNANNTITVASTAGLQVGQLVAGSGIPANAVITAIVNGTQFTISANASATANTALTVYQNPTVTLTGITTTAGTAVTVPGTANLYAGAIVAGVTGTGTSSGFIPSGTTIASITNGTSIVLSAAATAGTGNLVIALPGYANITSTSGTNTFGSSTAAQLVNSLTLNNPGTTTNTTINTALQLDSGGFLAIGTDVGPASTYNIGGTGILTGSNNLNREMIFHTVGANTTLNVNTPIFSNGSGLTKAGAGTMVLGTANGYTGDTVINGGTLKLAGGTNTIFRPFTTASTPGNASAAVTGQNLSVNFGGTLDLNGTTQAVGNLRSGNSVQLSGGTIFNSSGSTATFAVALNASNTWAGNISNGQSIGTITGNTIGVAGSATGGTINFVRDGNNTLTVNSPNTFSGSVTILGGATTLVDLGTFQNATAVNVTRSALIWNDTGVQAVSNRLNPTAPITLNGGGLQFVGRAGLDAITLGTLNIGTGASSVNPTGIAQGGDLRVTFAGIGTRATGGTLTFNGGNGAGFNIGDNPRVFFTSAPTLTNGIIGGWATMSGLNGQSQVGFATYDAASGVRALQYQGTTFGAGLNTLLNSNVTLPAPVGAPTVTTTNSITSTTGGTQLSFTNAGDTLVVQSGGILEGNASIAYGTTTIPGNIRPGAGNDLYLNILANTVTMNSKLIDSTSGGTNVVVSAMGASPNTATLSLTNVNTYTGTTYVSGVNVNLNSFGGPAIPGDLTLAGSNNLGADSLVDTQTQINWQQTNQIASAANVTMIGATRLNIGSTVPTAQTVPNSQTINNLTFNNDGGTNSANGPIIFTGAGGLTINGTLASVTPTELFTVPTINGLIALNNATPTIQVDANQYSPNQITLAINAGITTTASTLNKTGAGFLGIGGQSHSLVGTTTNLNAGGLAWSPSTGTASAVYGSAIVMGANTTIDARGNNSGSGYGGLVVGSIASSNSSAALANTNQGLQGNITTGIDNTSTSFAGTINSPFATGQLNLTKAGTGSWTLTGNSQSTVSNTLVNQGGNIALNSAGALNFQTYTLNSGGSVTLDNSSTAQNNRLGGAFYTHANTLAPTARTLNMQGGNLTIIGNSGSAVNEALGNVTIGGGGIVTLGAAGTAGVNVTMQSMGGQGQPTSLLIRGDGLGNAAGANTATIQFVTAGALGSAPGFGLLGGGGANGTLTKSIRPDILVDSSATGNGSSFLTIDTVSGLLRPLNATTELTGNWITTTAVNTNVSLNSIAVGSTTATSTLPAGGFSANFANSLGSLTLQNGGGVNLAIVPGNSWGANGGLLTVTNSATAGILNVAGNNSLNAGVYATGGVTQDYNVVTGSTFTLNAAYTNTTGMTKAGGGTLLLNYPQLSNTSTTVAINGGTVKFNGGSLPLNYFFYYINGSGAPGAENVALNNGTLDVNGVSTVLGAVTTTNPLAFAGGTAGSPNSVLTNSNATFATVTLNNTNSVIGTVFSGNLNLDKAGNTTMTLSSPQTYAGTTAIRGGVLTLRDQATLAGTSSISANYAELIVDNTGLNNIAQRVSATTPVTLTGGAYRFNVTSAASTHNIGAVTLGSGTAGGSNLFYINQYSNNGNSSAPTFNIANINQTNGSTLIVEAPYNGALGNFANANAHVYINNVNGAPFNASSMVNGIVAPWMIVANTGAVFNWATYSNVAGLTIPGSNGTAGYGAIGGGATVNASLNANTLSVAGQTLNSLSFQNPAAATTLGLNGPTDQLVLASGGLLISNSANQGMAIQGGSLTAGAANAPSTLYLNAYSQNTLTINTRLVNNGTGAMSIVRSGPMTVTLNPLVVESLTTTQLPANSATITVPSSSGLFVGMGVSGTGITAGSTITAIAGNTITLSANTSATANTGTAQIAFAPPASAATSSTTVGTPTVTTAANAFPTNFTPTVGMAVGGANIPGGTTLLSFTGTNATGFTLTLSQNALATVGTNAITLGALSNAYTGTTTVNATVDQYAGGTTNLSGSPGSIVIPGNLTINGGATVTMNTNQGQIAATSNVTINGGGILNLVGTNTLNSLTFNNIGGNATPTVAAGTLLNLSAANAITAVNDNTGNTPTVSGTTLNLANAAPVINVSGASLNGLTISSAITSAGTITKSGTGSLILPNANAAALTWNLTGGSIFVNNATALGTSTAAGALAFNGNVGLSSAGNTGMTIALNTVFNGPTNLSLGSSHGNNQVTLTGTMNLNGQSPTITVNAQPTTDAITGQIIGTGGFTKAGPGALTLTPATASTFTGNVSVTGGLLTLGNANALNMATGTGTNTAADVTVGSTAAINLNATAQNFGSLAGGGLVTNSGGAATLTIGSATNATNANFSGSLVAATTANLAVTKVGTTNQTLSGQNYYTGNTTVNAGTLTVRNGFTGASATATMSTLANTAITVASGATLAVRADGSDVGTSNTVNAGFTTTGATTGATLTLSPGTTGTGANFSMVDGVIGTFNLQQGSTFAGSGLTIGGAGTLTTNAPVMSFEIGSTVGSIDKLNVSKGVTVNATGGQIAINTISTSGIALGDYTFITAASGLGDTKLTLANTTVTSNGKTYNLSLANSTAGTEVLSVTAATPNPAYWSGAVDGNWNTGIVSGVTNWRTDATSNSDTQAVPGATSNVFFTTSNPAVAAQTTTLGADFTINSLTYTPGAASINIAGANTLTLNASGTAITVPSTAAAQTISANLAVGATQTWANDSSLTVSGSVSNGANNLTVSGAGTTTLSGVLGGGAGNLAKTGSGSLILAAATGNTYTGGTTITGGTLVAANATGSATGTGTVAVNGATATLAGGGSIAGDLTVTSGTVSPGQGSTTAALTVGGNVTLTGSTSALRVKINGTNPISGYDQLTITNGATDKNVTLTNAALTVNFGTFLTNTGSETFVVVNNTTNGTLSGAFTLLNVEPTAYAGASANVTLTETFTGSGIYTGTDANGFVYTEFAGVNSTLSPTTPGTGNDVVLSVVPEPGTLGLAALAGVGLLARRRRRSAR